LYLLLIAGFLQPSLWGYRFVAEQKTDSSSQKTKARAVGIIVFISVHLCLSVAKTLLVLSACFCLYRRPSVFIGG
jgi:hypothetical protein